MSAHGISCTRRDDGVLEVTLCSPEQGNRFDTEMLLALRRAFTERVAEGVRAVLLSHTGDAFCLGGRLNNTLNDASARAFAQALGGALMAVAQCCVPVLAALEGRAEGGGLSIVEACDLAAAADTATFAIPEIRDDRPPVVSFASASLQVPEKCLLEMAYLGTSISAEQAARFGLITRVVAPGEARAQCERWIDELTGRDPAALQVIRQLRQQTTGEERARRVDAASEALIPILTRGETRLSTPGKDANIR